MKLNEITFNYIKGNLIYQWIVFYLLIIRMNKDTNT